MDRIFILICKQNNPRIKLTSPSDTIEREQQTRCDWHWAHSHWAAGWLPSKWVQTPQPRPRCASAQCPLSGQASADNNIITSATEVERMSERERGNQFIHCVGSHRERRLPPTCWDDSMVQKNQNNFFLKASLNFNISIHRMIYYKFTTRFIDFWSFLGLKSVSNHLTLFS